jgi:hypothetical protein
MARSTDVLSVRLPCREADAFRRHARDLGVPVNVALRAAVTEAARRRADVASLQEPTRTPTT